MAPVGALKCTAVDVWSLEQACGGAFAPSLAVPEAAWADLGLAALGSVLPASETLHGRLAMLAFVPALAGAMVHASSALTHF